MLIELNEEQIKVIKIAIGVSTYDLGENSNIIKALDNPINITDTCPYCGTSEMLCGYNGVGCNHEPDEEEE